MYNIFSQLLEERGITSYKVAKEIGISNTTLSQWKSGRSIPKSDTIKKIADYFNVSVDYLLGKEIETDFYKYMKYQKMIKLYDTLDNDDKKMIIDIMIRLKKEN